MSSSFTPQTQGLRHLALWVRDIERSTRFYREHFGMKIVWQPDPENVYLSSGSDNLALHQAPADRLERLEKKEAQFLDHFGFIVESPEQVEAFFQTLQEAGVPIVKPVRRHRDGSVSFYLADPDGLVIQVLYEPHLSRREERS